MSSDIKAIKEEAQKAHEQIRWKDDQIKTMKSLWTRHRDEASRLTKSLEQDKATLAKENETLQDRKSNLEVQLGVMSSDIKAIKEEAQKAHEQIRWKDEQIETGGALLEHIMRKMVKEINVANEEKKAQEGETQRARDALERTTQILEQSIRLKEEQLQMSERGHMEQLEMLLAEHKAVLNESKMKQHKVNFLEEEIRNVKESSKALLESNLSLEQLVRSQKEQIQQMKLVTREFQEESGPHDKLFVERTVHEDKCKALQEAAKLKREETQSLKEEAHKFKKEVDEAMKELNAKTVLVERGYEERLAASKAASSEVYK